jgi:hypothetical protein
MMHDGLYVNLFFQRSDVWQNRIMTCKVGSHVAPASLYEIIGRHDAKCDAILWRCPGASGIGLLQPEEYQYCPLVLMTLLTEVLSVGQQCRCAYPSLNLSYASGGSRPCLVQHQVQHSR